MIRGFAVILACATLLVGVASVAGQAAGAGESGEAARSAADSRNVRSAVERVLSRPEFAGLQKSSWEKWLAKWQRRILDAVSSVLGALPGWLAWVILIWAVLTLLAILGHFVFVLLQTTGMLGAPRRARPSPSQARESWLGVPDLRFEPVYRRAHELRRNGHWAEAIRYFYVAALLWLDDRGRLTFERWKTDRDYRSELAGEPTVRQRFDSAARLFEEATYGGAPATEVACDQMAALLERLRDELGTAESR